MHALAGARSLAQIHAAFWGCPPLGVPQYLDFPALWLDYCDRFEHLLPGFLATPDFFAFGNFVATHWNSLTSTMSSLGPTTLVHGDPQLDNLLFEGEGAGAKLIDWQFAGSGCGIIDLGYFLISSFSPEMRRKLSNCGRPAVFGFSRALVGLLRWF